ncbi:acyl-CoA synthetase [Sphingopyxis sp.]|uniref:acyl-CoA synthetase n=1 Tax=Sphingopyxis sp. TaxID=1908224 RepID=UPI003D111D37
MTGLAITQALHRAVRETPDRIATVDGARQRTWREIASRTRRIAGALATLGVTPGDRVALLAPNGDLFVDFLFGSLWVGAVACPVNTRWTAGEIGYALADCGAEVLIADPAFAAMLADIRREAPALREVVVAGAEFEALVADAAEGEEHLRHGDDLAMILYTGGTTGRSKGVMLSHRALMTYALCLAGAGDAAPGACMLHTAPLFHVGAISGFLACLLGGGRHVFLPAFEAEAVMAAIAGQQVTDIFLVPTMLQALLDHPRFGAHDLTSARRIYYGAAPMPPALMDRAIAAMPRVGFVQGYGMTETSGSISLLKPADHRDPARLRSAGRAVLAIEARIVDADDNEVPVGEVGEIVARGEAVMTGYWNRPEETAEALRGGWMHTGDVGRMDADGYIHVVDRLKDMIITGGENVYSVEVEAVLADHPAVSQCAIVGLPDPRWGERVHAVVVAKPGVVPDADDIIAHMRAKLAAYKCPRSVEFRSVMPLSAAGKILKAELRG